MKRRQAMMSLALALAAAPTTIRAEEVATAFGPVRLADQLRRIVTLDTAGAIAVNHGLVPVGTTAIDDLELTETGRALAADLPLIGQSTYDGQLRFERILALRPDFIVGMIRGGTDYGPLYRKLSSIAPTVLLRSEGAGRLLDVTHDLAGVMGLGRVAEAEKAAYLATCAQMRASRGEALRRAPFAVLSGLDRQVIVYASNSWAGRILGDLGAAMPAITAGADRNGIPLSYEHLDRLTEVGAILYPVIDGAPSPEVAHFWDLPGFQALPAVQSGHVLGLPDLWPETFLTAMPFLQALDGLLARMTA